MAFQARLWQSQTRPSYFSPFSVQRPPPFAPPMSLWAPAWQCSMLPLTPNWCQVWVWSQQHAGGTYIGCLSPLTAASPVQYWEALVLLWVLHLASPRPWSRWLSSWVLTLTAGNASTDVLCDGLEHLIVAPSVSAFPQSLWAATHYVLEGPLSLAQGACCCVDQTPAVQVGRAGKCIIDRVD